MKSASLRPEEELGAPNAALRAPSRRNTRGAMHLGDEKDPTLVYLVRPGALEAHPPAVPVVCASFADTGRCPRGGGCPLAHVPLSLVTRLRAHVAPHHELAQKNPSVAGPEQQPRGDPLSATLLHVGLGDSARDVEVLRAAECLVTRALGLAATSRGGARRMAHCRHYTGRRGVCHLGLQCRFVHAASPSAAARVAVGPASDGTDDAQSLSSRSGPGGLSCGGMTSATTSSASQEAALRKFPFSHTPYAARPRASLPQAGSSTSGSA